MSGRCRPNSSELSLETGWFLGGVAAVQACVAERLCDATGHRRRHDARPRRCRGADHRSAGIAGGTGACSVASGSRRDGAELGMLHLRPRCTGAAAGDFGDVALLDTLHHLQTAGIAWVGAGPDLARARLPVTLTAGGENVTVIGFTDHPAAFAAGPARPGAAYVDLRTGLDPWIVDAISGTNHGCVLVTPHWGPNMTTEPSSEIRYAADKLLRCGASLVAGHSAHVFHGVQAPSCTTSGTSSTTIASILSCATTWVCCSSLTSLMADHDGCRRYRSS